MKPFSIVCIVLGGLGFLSFGAAPRIAYDDLVGGGVLYSLLLVALGITGVVTSNKPAGPATSPSTGLKVFSIVCIVLGGVCFLAFVGAPYGSHDSVVGTGILCTLLLIALGITGVVTARKPVAPAVFPPTGFYPPAGPPRGGYGAPAATPLPPTMVFELPAARTQVFLRARVQVTSGPDAGRDFPVVQTPFHIGRGPSAPGGRVNHVVLSEATVSSAQATIRHDAAKDTFYLVNDSHTNRTIVDGETKDVAALRSGSTIHIGATTLVFSRD